MIIRYYVSLLNASYRNSAMTRSAQHLDEVNETYFEHMGNAMSFAGHMLIGAFACAIHAVAPALFESAGSDRIRFLHERMVVMRKKTEHPASPANLDDASNPLKTAVSQGAD